MIILKGKNIRVYINKSAIQCIEYDLETKKAEVLFVSGKFTCYIGIKEVVDTE